MLLLTITLFVFILGDGSIRLVSGADSCQGRVEVFYKGNWGTVCDDDWGMKDAIVVCRQINCGQALDYKSNAYFGYGTGLILLDNVNCDGSETYLSACYSLGWGIHNCGHHEDAGIICAGKLQYCSHASDFCYAISGSNHDVLQLVHNVNFIKFSLHHVYNDLTGTEESHQRVS